MTLLLASTWADLVAELALAVELVLVVAVVVLWRAVFETRRRRPPPELVEEPIEREPFDQDAPSAPQTRRVGGTARDRPGETREDDPVL